MVVDKYSLPNNTDILDKLSTSQYFKTLDLVSGCHQVKMAPADMKKTSFSTEQGRYHFVVCRLNLRTALRPFNGSWIIL